MRTTKAIVVVLTLVALESCSGGKASRSNTDLALDWKDAAGGSKIAYEGHPGFGSMRRCWKRSSRWDCIHISDIDYSYMASRYSRTALDQNQDISSIIEGEGYSCEFDPSWVFAEHIATKRGYVAQNFINLGTSTNGLKPWTKDYVITFIAENSIGSEKPYFDCKALAYQILGSSLATVGTTTISFEGIME